eukprot:COSAG06_NODE_3165_length_5745_cov_3.246900_4_plen_91_part_00
MSKSFVMHGIAPRLSLDLIACLSECMPLSVTANDPKTTFITDRGPGLTAALGKFFPHASHRNCTEHLKRNAISKLGNLQQQERHRGMDRQ